MILGVVQGFEVLKEDWLCCMENGSHRLSYISSFRLDVGSYSYISVRILVR